MRVVGGKLRHRIIQMTNLETTRETQDKVREAIFNMIGPYFDGGSCLDLFAGSGAMGIEAYSRGIKEIYLNDIEKQAIAVCKKNCQSLQIDEAFFSSLDYHLFARDCSLQFNLIILDPPYRMDDTEEILSTIYPLVKENGIVVFEMGRDSPYPERLFELELIKNKTYGIKRVAVYRRCLHE